MVKYTDAGDNTTETHYDVRGRVELVDPPSGPSIGYEYDGLDRLITSNILNGTTIVMANTIEYDYAGRKTGMDDEDMGELEYAYDALNLTSQEDARGCTTLTTMKYTGQREESLLGLYFYNARWYDSKLGRFIQADTIIPEPGNPMAWDRYAYTINNPVNYIDPTGPVVEGMCGGKACKKRQYNDILINTP